MRASLVGAACCAVLALAGCAATPPEEDPVQIKLNDLDTRLARIERVVSNNSLLQLANQTEALQSDLRSMRNDVDVLNHALDANRKQTKDLYADLDQRLKALEARNVAAGGAAGAPGAGPAAAGAASAGAAGAGAAGAGTASGAGAAGTVNSVPGSVSDTVSYQAAFELLKNNQFDQAVVAFKQFLVNYPDSSLADNAQYWLGEAYYVNKVFPDALAAFQRVAEKYPQSRKLPDALLKVGYCDYELKQWQAAKDVLTQVAANYADTPAGHLAQQRLEKMAAEKH